MSVQSIKRVEAVCYPLEMQTLQAANSLEDIARYCECPLESLEILQGEGWYALIGRHQETLEVVDLAALPGKRVLAVRSLIRRLSGEQRIITLDARISTSYPMIKKLERLGKIEVISETPWNWGSNEMAEMKVRVL